MFSLVWYKATYMGCPVRLTHYSMAMTTQICSIFTPCWGMHFSFVCCSNMTLKRKWWLNIYFNLKTNSFFNEWYVICIKKHLLHERSNLLHLVSFEKEHFKNKFYFLFPKKRLRFYGVYFTRKAYFEDVICYIH